MQANLSREVRVRLAHTPKYRPPARADRVRRMITCDRSGPGEGLSGTLLGDRRPCPRLAARCYPADARRWEART